MKLQLLSSVTHLLHNAWLPTYDDDLPLSIFDGSLRMLRDLVDFALSSPLLVRLLFISSIDTLRGTSESFQKSTCKREGVEGPASLQGPAVACNATDGGAYGESKWVGEQVLQPPRLKLLSDRPSSG